MAVHGRRGEDGCSWMAQSKGIDVMAVHGRRAGLEFVSALFVLGFLLVVVLVFLSFCCFGCLFYLHFEHGHANV